MLLKPLKMEFVHIQLLYHLLLLLLLLHVDVDVDDDIDVKNLLLIFVYSKQHDEHQLYKEHFHHIHEYVLIQVDLQVYDHV
jgi:hypothetical protein